MTLNGNDDVTEQTRTQKLDLPLVLSSILSLPPLLSLSPSPSSRFEFFRSQAIVCERLLDPHNKANRLCNLYSNFRTKINTSCPINNLSNLPYSGAKFFQIRLSYVPRSMMTSEGAKFLHSPLLCFIGGKNF